MIYNISGSSSIVISENLDKSVKTLHPCPDKVAEPNTSSFSSSFEQYTLLSQLANAEAQSKPLDDAIVIDEPVKLIAGSSKHPDDMDVVDSEPIY